MNPESVNLKLSVNNEGNPIEGAEVIINESSSITGSAGGCTLKNVPTGSNELTILAEGYDEYTETIDVSEENTIIDINLTETEEDFEEEES